MWKSGTWVTTLCLLITMGISQPVVAQVFGFVGEKQGPELLQHSAFPNFEIRGTRLEFDGAIGATVAPGTNLIGEAQFGRDILSSPYSAVLPQVSNDLNIAGHVWRVASPTARIGVFGGLATAEDRLPGNNNAVLGYAGVEVLNRFAPGLMGFGQIGYASSGSTSGSGPHGFGSGIVGRVGIAWNGLSRTFLRLEIEGAGSDTYAAAATGFPGLMYGVNFGGETEIGANGRWVATYDVSLSKFGTIGVPDGFTERKVTAGLRYVFGGKSASERYWAGMIGTPRLPVRANALGSTNPGL